MITTRPIALAAAFSLAASAFLAHAESDAAWSQFRGLGNTGIAPDLAIPSTITEKDYAWKIELPGSGHSSPAIWGDKIFVTCEKDGSGKRSLVCLSAADGKQLWAAQDEFSPYQQHRFNSFASSTPCADAARVYVSWTDGSQRYVIAYDHGGKEAWRKMLGAFKAQHGSAASPILAAGVLMITNDGEEGSDGFIAGLDPATGDEKWRIARKIDKASYATPIVLGEGDATQVITTCSAVGATSLDPRTGEVNWETGEPLKNRCVASPVYADGVLFFTAGQGNGGKECHAFKIDIKDPKKKPEPAWGDQIKGLPYVPTPLAIDGVIYMWNDSGMMTAFRAKDGSVLYDRERVGGEFYCSPVAIGDRIVSVSRTGEIMVAGAGKTFEMLGKADLGEDFNATPAVANGRLYLRTTTHLICVAGKS